jgi:hypothetical protein
MVVPGTNDLNVVHDKVAHYIERLRNEASGRVDDEHA